jgi:hypothetical protein
MRQCLKHSDTEASYGSVLVCVVLICGALFGMAAQTWLLHLGLDFGSLRDDLLVAAAARPRAALAWWAWWLFPLGAFLIGPLSVTLTRWIIANWWLFRAVRLTASATVVLALAVFAELPPAPSTLDVRAGAVASLAVVTLSTLLAWLGARILGDLGRVTAHAPASALPVRRRTPAPPSEQVRFRVAAPIPAAPPRPGGGSAAAAPFVRRRQRHALIARFTIARLALVAMTATVVLAAMIGVSSVTVLIEHATPGGIRQVVVWSGLRVPEPPRAAEAIGLAAAAPPVPVAEAEPSGMVIDGVLIPERELTFAEGYRKRQAVLAAQRASVKIVAAAEKAEAKLPAQLKHVAALRPVDYGRIHRRVAQGRHGDARQVERRVERHVERHYRVHRQYTRQYTRDHHRTLRHADRAREHRRLRGHDRYALEPHYRVARF